MDGGEIFTQKHSLNIDTLIRIQKKISEKALSSIKARLLGTPRTALGLDAAYSKRYGGVAIAALVDISNCSLIEYSVSIGEPKLEYIPGLLAFREAALFYAAIQRLKHRSYDIIVVDGHGVSHPRYAGIATHIGLALAKPSIGVAKKKLYGVLKIIKSRESCHDFPCVIGELIDKKRNNLVLAYVVIPKSRDKSPIYISPGAHISLDDAYRVISLMLEKSPSKLPCPTYYADKLSKKIARGLDAGTLSPRSLKLGSWGTLDRYLG